MEEKDGQIKAKEESNRWSWKIPKLELRGQGRKKHVVKKMKQAKLCSSRLYQICHVVDTSSSPHLNIIHIHIRSLVNRSVVLLWDSQFLCQGSTWKACETWGGMLEHKMGHRMNDEHHLERKEQCDETSQLKRSKALNCEEKLLEDKIEVPYRFNVSRIFRSHGEDIYVPYNEKDFHKALEIKCTIKLRFVHVITFVHVDHRCFLQFCI